MTLGETLQTRRNGKQMKQHDAATRLGISSNYLSLIENGWRVPGLTLLKRMANLYGCAIEVQIRPDAWGDPREAPSAENGVGVTVGA